MYLVIFEGINMELSNIPKEDTFALDFEEYNFKLQFKKDLEGKLISTSGYCLVGHKEKAIKAIHESFIGKELQIYKRIS